MGLCVFCLLESYDGVSVGDDALMGDYSCCFIIAYSLQFMLINILQNEAEPCK